MDFFDKQNMKIPIQLLTNCIFTIGYLGSFCLFLNCHGTSSSSNQNREGFIKADTVALLQTMLEDKELDSLLSFAFEGRPLKIIRNEVIREHYSLTYDNKPVVFTDIDSTSDELLMWDKPRFFAHVDRIRRLEPNQAEVTMSWRGIGLLCRYKFVKDPTGVWRITERNTGKF
ncbi:hypothetical protein [Larkinella soli]|uniref:hypothetical protein n=1 Tax=Larkinella soli TaxID=1770527 RepID=UPI000FFC4DA0|nr:hypothetical protein [Larkinella soli]